jgi:hypothetical protein
MYRNCNLCRLAGHVVCAFLLLNVTGLQARADDEADRKVGGRAKEKPPLAQESKEIFAAIDANGDGSVTEKEFEKAFEEKVRKMRRQARRSHEHKSDERSECGEDCQKCDGKGCHKGESRHGKSGKSCPHCRKSGRGAAHRGAGQGTAQIVHVHHHHYYGGSGSAMHHRGPHSRHQGPGHHGKHSGVKEHEHGDKNREHDRRVRRHDHRTGVDWKIDELEANVGVEIDAVENDSKSEYEGAYEDEETYGQAELKSDETVVEESEEPADTEAVDLTESLDQDDTDAV